MQIAFLASNRDPSVPSMDSDGAPVTVKNYALWLSKFGHGVDIYVYKVIPNESSKKYTRDKFILQKEKVLELFPNVRVVRLEVPDQTSQNMFENINVIDVPEIIQSIIGAENFKDDLLSKYDATCIFHPLASFGVMFRNFTSLQKTILFPMLLSDEYSKFKSVSPFYVELEQIALNNVGRIFSSSSSEKEILILRGIKKNKIRVIPRGIDLNIFKYVHKNILSRTPKTLKLITIGSLRPQKRQSILVDVIEDLLSKGIDSQLLLIGENHVFTRDIYEKYYEDMVREISKRGLKKRIIFEGGLKQSAVAKFLDNSDVAIFPSVSESFGKAAIESICSGTPTVLTKECPAYQDFAKGNVNSILSGSSSGELSKSILKLINNPVLYSNISKNGQLIRDKYNWETVTRILERELNVLINSY